MSNDEINPKSTPKPVTKRGRPRKQKTAIAPKRVFREQKNKSTRKQTQSKKVRLDVPGMDEEVNDATQEPRFDWTQSRERLLLSLRLIEMDDRFIKVSSLAACDKMWVKLAATFMERVNLEENQPQGIVDGHMAKSKFNVLNDEFNQARFDVRYKTGNKVPFFYDEFVPHFAKHPGLDVNGPMWMESKA